MHQFCRTRCRSLCLPPPPILMGIHVCFFIRMTTRAALAPPVAVSQTAPRPWPSPAASNRLPPATRTCPQVSDGPGAREAIPPPCSENDHQGRHGFSGGGRGHRVRPRLGPTDTTEKSCFFQEWYYLTK